MQLEDDMNQNWYIINYNNKNYNKNENSIM